MLSLGELQFNAPRLFFWILCSVYVALPVCIYLTSKCFSFSVLCSSLHQTVLCLILEHSTTEQTTWVCWLYCIIQIILYAALTYQLKGIINEFHSFWITDDDKIRMPLNEIYIGFFFLFLKHFKRQHFCASIDLRMVVPPLSLVE